MPRATGEPGAEQGPGHKLQQPGQLPLPARFQQPQLIPPPNAPLCPASRSTLPLGFGELRSPLPKTAQTPHHGVRSAAETRSCNTNPSSHAFSAAWLPVTLQSNTSPRLQERGLSRGGGQWGGGVPPPTNPVGEGGLGRPQAAEGCVAALLAWTRKQRIDEGDGSQHALRWAIFSAAGRAGVWEPKSEFISICECSSRGRWRMHCPGAADPSRPVLGLAYLGFGSSSVHPMSLSSAVPRGDSATTPRLGAVNRWMHMDTGQGQSRGDGLHGVKGLFGKN